MPSARNSSGLYSIVSLKGPAISSML
jgi:hypothetical protein